MEQPQKPAKKKRRGLTALIVLLSILFILVGIPMLYLSCFGFAYDKGEALAESKPMPTAERYRFYADTRTMDISAEPADLWWLLYKTDRMAGVFDEIDATLAPFKLTLKKAGISFDEAGMSVAAKLVLGGVVPLPLRADFGLAAEGPDVTVTLERVWLGRLISVDAATLCEKLSLNKDTLRIALNLGEVHSRLEAMTSVRTEPGRLVMRCGMGDVPADEILSNYDFVDRASDYLGDFEAIAVAKAIHNGDGAVYDTLLRSLEADAGHYAEFRKSELAIAEDYVVKLYFQRAENQLLARFMPEVTAENVAALSEVYEAERASREENFRAIVKNLEQMFIRKEISIAGTGFVNLAADGAPLTLEQLAGSDWASVSEWLSEEETRIVYGHGGNYYQADPLEPLRKMPRELPDTLAIRDMRIGDVYNLLLMTRMTNDRPVLAYYVNGGRMYLTELTEEQYGEYLSAQHTPVYELGLEGVDIIG